MTEILIFIYSKYFLYMCHFSKDEIQIFKLDKLSIENETNL